MTCLKKCVEITRLIVLGEEDKAIQLFDESDCTDHYYNLGYAIAFNSHTTTFEKLLFKVIDKIVHFNHYEFLSWFGWFKNKPVYVEILLSKFDRSNILYVILELLYINTPEETFDLFLNEVLYDFISKISENKLHLLDSKILFKYRNLTPIQYVNFNISKKFLFRPNYDKLCRFAFVQLENTMADIFEDSNTGMLPELINLATQYHDF